MGTLKLRTFRIGTPATRGQGLRIGTTRRPPRGVARDEWRRGGYFDVWLPILAPSAGLLRRLKSKDRDDPRVWTWFFDAYERELARTDARQCVELLADLARRTPIAIGCFCEDERRCHRSRLKDAIVRTAAQRA
jgi:uncharacterized protein YeaO (DUF488 family)